MYSNVLLLPMLLPCVVRCLLLLFCSCVAYYNLSMAIHARCLMLWPRLLREPLLRWRPPASHAGYKTQCGHSVRFRPQEEPLLSTGFRGFVSFGGYRWLFRLDTCPRPAIGPIGRSGRGLLQCFLLDRGQLSWGLPGQLLPGANTPVPTSGPPIWKTRWEAELVGNWPRPSFEQRSGCATR